MGSWLAWSHVRCSILGHQQIFDEFNNCIIMLHLLWICLCFTRNCYKTMVSVGGVFKTMSRSMMILIWVLEGPPPEKCAAKYPKDFILVCLRPVVKYDDTYTLQSPFTADIWHHLFEGGRSSSRASRIDGRPWRRLKPWPRSRWCHRWEYSPIRRIVRRCHPGVVTVVQTERGNKCCNVNDKFSEFICCQEFLVSEIPVADL